jgi:hypothetical protein
LPSSSSSSGADVIATPSPSPGPSGPATSAAPASGSWPHVPRLKIGYRRFGFSRLASAAATSSATTPAAGTTPESFESLSLDVYPISWYLRVGLSSQFGWESGQFERTGDYFVAESASVGFQLPGRFTPFAEALAGAGYMRRRQAETDTPTAYWQLGIDAGVEIYFANRAYGSIALGYLHPASLRYANGGLETVKLDTWSLKVGVGI